jgi:predicted GIY-YIG superfamily endonuclease
LSVQGNIYLLHFDEPLAHAKHYMGWTQADPPRRLASHESGGGSRLMSAVMGVGGGFELVRVWAGDRHLERRLKNRKEGPRLCPLCVVKPKPVNAAPCTFILQGARGGRTA